MRDLPVEARLRELARRFADAERRVRSLLQEAPTGDRRALLEQALAVLLDLRKDAQFASLNIQEVFNLSALALRELIGVDMPLPSGEKVKRLGDSLQARLTVAIGQAEAGSHNAFATVTAERLEKAEREAVAARINKAGQLIVLGPEAAMLTRTIGRRAVCSANLYTLGVAASVTISGGTCPICIPKQGTQPASVEPPFHAHCDCTATPTGYSVEEHVAAMRVVANYAAAHSPR